jgi:hypothetical protein
MKLASLIGILVLAFVFGCGPAVKEGNKIDTTKMREIYKGYTTSDEVVAKLGKPAEIKKMPTGEEKYIYKYNEEEYTHWWTLPRLYKQDLEVTIKDGVVQNYVYTRMVRDRFAKEDE